MGGGAVIRDSQGKLIAAICFDEEFVVSLFITEVKVPWRSLFFCSEIGLHVVVIFERYAKKGCR